MTHTEDTVFIVFEPDYCVRKEDEEARQEFIRAVNMESAGVENLDEVGDFLNDAAVKHQFEQEHAQYKAELKRHSAVGGDDEVTWPHVPPSTSSGSSGASGSDQLPGTQPKRVAAKGRSYAGDTDIVAPAKPTAPESTTPETARKSCWTCYISLQRPSDTVAATWFGWAGTPRIGGHGRRIRSGDPQHLSPEHTATALQLKALASY